MSIDYTLTRIPDWEKRCFRPVEPGEDLDRSMFALPRRNDTVMHAKTFALIFGCINIGIPSITAENHREVWKRICTYEKACGALCGTDKADAPFTAEDIANHIGLTVNATPLSRAAWVKKFYEICEDRAMRGES